MQIYSHQLGCQHLLELDRVVSADQEHMFVHETTCRLLRHFQRLEPSSVNHINVCEDWLVLWLCLERNVFACDEVNDQWVELFTIELTQH